MNFIRALISSMFLLKVVSIKMVAVLSISMGGYKSTTS